MMIKFLSHGTGSGVEAANYLLGRFDANGQERQEVTVLRGDPLLVGSLADTLKFKNRYTSGVLAWHLDDDPSSEDLAQVLDDMEALAFAGLVPDQYVFSAVLHVAQDNSKHIHWFTAHVELSSGNSFNVAPPGHLSAFDALRDKWNYRRGWARPDDPNRNRLINPGPSWHGRERQRKNQSLGASLHSSNHEVDGFEFALSVEPDTRKVLEDLAIQLVFEGGVISRQELVDGFNRWGEVTRTDADYISVKVNGAKKAIRLKGEIFSIDADYRAIRSAAVGRQVDEGPLRAYAHKPNDVVDDIKAEEANTRLEAAMASRRVYNQKRYPSFEFVPSPSPRRIENVKQEDVPKRKSTVADALEESLLLTGRSPYLSAMDELVDCLSELIGEPQTQQEIMNHAHNERTGNAASQDLKATARRTYDADSSFDRAAKAVSRCVDSVVRTCRRAVEFIQREQQSVSRRGIASKNRRL
jgi:hypothetical protein